MAASPATGRNNRTDSLVYWSYEQTPHLFDLIDHLAEGRSQCSWVTEVGLSEERAKLGFHAVRAGRVQTILAENVEKAKEIGAKAPEETLHVFHGVRGFMMNRVGFMAAAAAGARIALVTENRNEKGWRSGLRKLGYRADAGMLRKHVQWIFINGFSGPYGGKRFYSDLSWPKDRLFPFGYFGEASEAHAVEPKQGPFRMVYVGQLIPRKGIDILLKALGTIRNQDWRLHIIGEGHDRQNLETLSAAQGIAERVSFDGVCPLREVGARISDFDLFVLPSRFDGWGMVVNEALSRGLPVVCSNTCGAQDLLTSPLLGEAFESEDSADLAKILTRKISSPRESVLARESRRQWYNQHATAVQAAQYMNQVLAGGFTAEKSNLPPWALPPPEIGLE